MDNIYFKGVMAVSSIEGKRKYLYEDNIACTEDLKSVIGMMEQNRLCFTKKGIEYLTYMFSYEDVCAAFKELHPDSFDESMTDSVFSYVVKNERDVIPLNREKLFAAMDGSYQDFDTDKDFFIVSGEQAYFDEDTAVMLLKRLYQNIINNQNTDYSKIYRFWSKLYKFLFVLTSSIHDIYDYSLATCLDIIPDNKEEFKENFGGIISAFEGIKKNQGKDFYQKEIPSCVLCAIYINMKGSPEKKSWDDNTKTKFRYVLEKAAEKTRYGLISLAYSYYDGDEFYPCDYKKSEELLLKLLEKYSFDHNIADALGYIYYYGRNNNGVPDYAKAFKYYQMASLCGNIEATYKIADMYYHGYGLEKNTEVAFQTYLNLLEKTEKEFDTAPESSSYADVVIRLGRSYLEDKKHEDHFYSLLNYLKALRALKIRNGKFDGALIKRIKENIRFIHDNYDDEIQKNRCLYINLNEIKAERVKVISMKPVILRFIGEKKALIVDVKNYTCDYDSVFDVEFEGKLMNTSKVEFDVDNIKNALDGSYFLKNNGKTVALISSGNTNILHKEYLMDFTPSARYKCAICTYSSSGGKKYTFLVNDKDYEEYKDNPEKMKNAKWFIEETSQDIFPEEFTEIEDTDLPCEVDKLKHIALR